MPGVRQAWAEPRRAAAAEPHISGWRWRRAWPLETLLEPARSRRPGLVRPRAMRRRGTAGASSVER
eukprot:425390-Prymnesium_polylepis.1